MAMRSGGSVLDAYPAIYQEVATELSRVLPAGWQTAWVQVEMEDGNGSIACFAAVPGAPKPMHVKLPVRVFDLFAKMREIARGSDPAGAWTNATFVLKNAGAFTVDYGYEPVPIEDQYARRIAWKKKYGLT